MHRLLLLTLEALHAALLGCGLVLAAPAIASAGETVAKDARLGGDRLRTRFVADLSKPAAFRVFTLAEPYRVIVDLADVKFKLPAQLGRKGKGLVTAYRYGLVGPGRARIVIDVNAPVLLDKSFVLKARDGQPARLVIDMVRTDRKTFLAGLKEGRSSQVKAAAQSKAASPPVVPPSARKPRGRGAKHVVVLDPGHGGVDPGAVSKSGANEKTIVFAFAKSLRKRLRATGRYKVVLTREIDSYIALRDRVKIARKAGGDLFISIHADSLPKRSANGVTGATVYTLSKQASDSMAKALAVKENRSDIIAGVELPPEPDDLRDFILIDLAQRATNNWSVAFARIVEKSLRGKTRLNKKPRRRAEFAVLKAPDIPSILIELGYLSNADDEKLLASAAWRKKVAAAVAAAVDKYFSKRVAGMPF